MLVQLDIQALDHTPLDLRGLLKLQTLWADAAPDCKNGGMRISLEAIQVQFPASLQDFRCSRPLTDSSWVSLSCCRSLKHLEVQLKTTPPVVLRHCLQRLQVSFLASMRPAFKWAGGLAARAQVVDFEVFGEMRSLAPCLNLSKLHVYGRADTVLLEGLQVHDLHVQVGRGSILRLPAGLSIGSVVLSDSHLTIDTSLCPDLQSLDVSSPPGCGEYSFEVHTPGRLIKHRSDAKDGTTTIKYRFT